MIDEEILIRTYEVPVETLWKGVKEALNTLDGATLKIVNEKERRATFTTGMSWTSWGEEMFATVEPFESKSATLRIIGHPHTQLLTTRWGEELHQHRFIKDFTHAIDRALETT